MQRERDFTADVTPHCTVGFGGIRLSSPTLRHSCQVPVIDTAEPECHEHRARLSALKDELALLLDCLRRESEVSAIGAENTLRLLRVEIDRHFAKSRELATALLEHQRRIISDPGLLRPACFYSTRVALA